MKNGLLRSIVLAAILVSLGYAMSGCGSKLQGTYTEPGGNFVLVIKSGGKADLTTGGVLTPCTYTVNGSDITLTCENFDDPMTLTAHDDGSLTCLPGTPLPTLKKK